MIGHFQGRKKISHKPILIELIGQSNVTGAANSPSSWLETNAPQYFGLIPNAYVYNYTTGLFAAMNVGVNHNGGIGMDGTVFGVSPSLMRSLADWNRGKAIYLMQHGIPSTQLQISGGENDWSTESENEHYDVSSNKTLACITILNNLYGADAWRGPFICWNQGENDSAYNYLDTYEANEINLINQKRTDYGRNSHFIASGCKGRTTLNNIKIANAAKNARNHYIDNEDLVFGQSPHYDQASNILHGFKFANLIKTLI